jgi:hypothetical protein
MAGVEKHSITLPAEASEAVRARVGSRGFSAYIANAVARQLERDALDDIIRRTEEKYGPLDEAQVDAILGRLAE